MSTLRVIHDLAGCLICIPEGESPVAETELSYFDKTPNSAMVKEGIFRYPFNSTKVEITARSRLIAETSVGSYNLTAGDDTKLFESLTTYGTQGEAYAIGNGGAVWINYFPGTKVPKQMNGCWLSERDNYYVLLKSQQWGEFHSSAIQCVYIRRTDYAYYVAYPVEEGLSPFEALGRVMGGNVPPPNPDLFYGSTGYNLLVTPTPVNLSRSYVDNLCGRISSMCCVDEHVMSAEILNDLRITDVNIPAFFTELPKFGQSTLDICKNIKALTASTSFRDAVAHAGRANLAYQYGDRLSISDAQALLRAGKEVSTSCEMFGPRWTKRLSTAEYAEAGLTAKKIVRYSVQASPADALSKGIYGLANLFNSQNVWDLIPFSFVIDWFINISDVAAAEDARVLNSILSYDHIYRSETLVLDINGLLAENSFLTGRVTKYARDRKYSMPEPDAKLSASFPNATQWLNGGSLLSQTHLKR